MNLSAFKKERILMPVGLALMVLAELLFFCSILDYCSGSISKVSVLSALGACLLMALILGWLILCSKEKPERVFLLLAIPMGVALACLLLPDQVPDERWHIYRAIDLRIFGGGTTVPSIMESMPTTYDSYRTALLETGAWENATWISRDLTSYFLHLYLVAHIVITLLRYLSVNPYVAVIVARVANGLVFTAVGYWCLKKMPHAKVMFFIFLLNPMLLQQEFSVSADSVVNIAALAFITYLFWMKFEKQIQIKNFVILTALGILMSISKFAYAPMLLLVLLLVPFIKSKKTQKTVYGVTAAVLVGGSAAVVATYRTGTYQLMFELIRDPVELVRVVAKSFYELGPEWVKETFGMHLGALNVWLWEPCFWLYLGVLAFTAVFNLGEQFTFKRIEKVFVLLFTFALFVVILLVFREWSITVDKRSDVIMGLQGRYLLPFIFLALSCAPTPRSSLYRKNCLVFYSGALAIIYSFALTAVFYRFL